MSNRSDLDLLKLVIKGSIFEDESLGNYLLAPTRQDIYKEFVKMNINGSDNKKFVKMKKIYEKHALKFFKEYYIPDLFLDTPYENDEKVISKYFEILKNNNIFMGKVNSNILKQIHKSFNKEIEPIIKAFAERIQQNKKLVDNKKFKIALESLKWFLDKFKEIDSIDNWAKAKQIKETELKKRYQSLGLLRYYLAESEIVKYIDKKSKITQGIKGIERIISSFEKMQKCCDKGLKIYNAIQHTNDFIEGMQKISKMNMMKI
ncbi:hypothetical protein AAEX28_13015 [Lentisphaerota bacterium WC36G]|nr:hypothetical protein LJT99_15840 [Lentisphaerae bacterium WC36]